MSNLTYEQGTNKPTSKVNAAGAGGALATVIIFVAGFFGIEIPPEVAAAAVTVVSFVSAYFRKDKVTDQEP